MFEFLEQSRVGCGIMKRLAGGIEHMDIRFGQSSDTFDLDIRQAGGVSVDTQLVLNAGDDHVTVQSVAGETRILGGDDDDTVVVGNDHHSTDEIVGKLHFDGAGTIVEQSAGVVYDSSIHDPVLANVSYVYVDTKGVTPTVPKPQFKERILTAQRTAHVTVLGLPTVNAASAGIERLDRTLAQYWSEAHIEFQGVVEAGQEWVLKLSDASITYTAKLGDSLQAVATGLADKNLPGPLRRKGRRLNETEKRRLHDLEKRRNKRADELALDPTLIASRATLVSLAADWESHLQELLPWQRDLLSP